jgi:hypothetical protein
MLSLAHVRSSLFPFLADCFAASYRLHLPATRRVKFKEVLSRHALLVAVTSMHAYRIDPDSAGATLNAAVLAVSAPLRTACCHGLSSALSY